MQDILTNGLQKGDRILREEFFNTAVELLKEFDFLPRNARRIKSFANIIDRISLCYKGTPISNRKFEVSQAIIIAYLYQYCQPIFRILQVQPDFYKTELVRWLNSPPLATIDRRTRMPIQPLPLHPAFEHLRVIKKAREGSDTSPTLNANELLSVFPDPVAEGFIRIQGLIQEIPDLTDTVRRQYLAQW